MPKLLVVSFEGLNYELLTGWIESGYLPNFKRVADEGHIGEIDCSRVPYEASGLISAFSGISDSEHGMLSYWKVHNKSYIPETWSSSEVKDIMLWNDSALKDYKFGMVNVFGTHPVYPLNGFMISYAMDKRTIRCTYPPTLIHELTRKGLPYVQELGAFFNKQEEWRFIGEVSKVEELRHNVSMELINQDVDVYIINYTCIDRLCHFYMSELRNDSISLEDKKVFQMYVNCDRILGDMLSIREKQNADILLMSSVGFGHLKNFVEINPYLSQKGFLKWGTSERQPDWARTVAFESVQGSHGININRKSFYNEGIVEDSEFESVLNQLIDSLKEMRNPHNDNPMFSSVKTNKDYYNNPKGPDIVIEPYDWEYVPYGDSYWSDMVSRHCQTGWHRNKSVWGGIGPKISGKVKGDKFGLVNIAPTINHLLGEPAKTRFKKESMIKL
jgi:predicted AlkP superfamily phosphohydrolase/phosphomutase